MYKKKQSTCNRKPSNHLNHSFKLFKPEVNKGSNRIEWLNPQTETEEFTKT